MWYGAYFGQANSHTLGPRSVAVRHKDDFIDHCAVLEAHEPRVAVALDGDRLLAGTLDAFGARREVRPEPDGLEIVTHRGSFP